METFDLEWHAFMLGGRTSEVVKEFSTKTSAEREKILAFYREARE